jgi:hypothetical protein
MTPAGPAAAYSRHRPSARYKQLLGFYQTLHREGDPAKGQSPQETFDGRSLPPQAWRIKCLIDMHGARTLLDYGAGKGLPYRVSPFILPDGTTAHDLKTYWGISSVTLYDPGYAPHSALPTGKFDAVISTDMLEHCSEEDLHWILAEMFGFASKFLFANVASFPAKKTLPDGTNAHCTIKPVAWWQQLFIDVARHHPSVRWYSVVQTRTDEPNGEYSFTEHLLKG